MEKEFARQEEIIREARAFTEKEIRPFAGDFERQEAIPRALIDKMAASGYLAACFPREYGGLGLNQECYGLFTEEIGKGCASTRALLTVHTSLVGETLLRFGNKEQKNEWLPLMARGGKIAAFALTEPDVGTDAKSVRTSYKKEGNGFVLNGRKKWITYGDIADFFLVIASDEGKVTAFLVEREFAGVKTIPIKGLLAGRAAHIAEIEFTNVAVPAEHVVGTLGSGFSFIANDALDHGRYSVAWAGVALAQSALEEMVNYSRRREQFGQKIYHFQLIQGMIADAQTKIAAARALCLRAGQLRDSGSGDALIETTTAKYFASRVAMEIAVDAVQVHGGNGCYDQYPVERLFREAKILEIIEGTSQVQQDIISRYALRKLFRST